MRKAEACILYEFNVDPRTLTDEEFIRFYQDYKWIKEEENKKNTQRNTNTKGS